MAYINGKEVLFSPRIGVEGAGPNLITKEITANGEYPASDDGADGFSSVTANIPIPTIIEAPAPITANGTYTASQMGADGISECTVNVPTYITVATVDDLPTDSADGMIAIVEG